MAASTPPPGADSQAGQARKDLADYQAFLADLGAALRALGEPAEIERTAARLLGRRLGAARAFYAEIEDETWAVVRQEYVEDASSAIGRLPLRGPDLQHGFRSGAPLVVPDVAADPRLDPSTRESLRARGVAALVASPLVKVGRWVAALVVHSAVPRAWTPHEA
ncbi:MAG: GAF domain-containing protein, partial [Vicinamibacterales bacterium]